MKQILPSALRLVLLPLLALFAFPSCKAVTARLLPDVSGKAGEVIVVIAKPYWDGATGECLRENLGADCPFLPQQEPLYTLVNVAPNGFTNLFKVHRNQILCNITGDPGTPPALRYKQDVWASPQSVVQIDAPDEAAAVTLIRENVEPLCAFFEQAERDRVVVNSRKFSERASVEAVRKLFDADMAIPNGYKVKKTGEDFLWISYDTQYTIQGLLLYRYPAEDPAADFTVEQLVAHRNEVLRREVPGMFENTWMTTSTFAEPGLKYLNYKGLRFAELRGYWEVENDYMGGPFVSHAFYSPDGRWIMVAEGFVYAPKYNKRNYLRQVDALLYSFAWQQKP